MLTTEDKILLLTRQLYPTGRAFRIPKDSTFEKWHKGLGVSEAQAFDDALSTLYAILPDNDNFTTGDATAWEKRLGLITDSSVSLADRKLAIKRKINHPGTIPARQNWEYMQDQLQAAGFDVYVHENIFSDGMGGFETRTPFELLGDTASAIVGLWEHGEFAEHGEIEHGDFTGGSVYDDCVANYIDYTKDEFFDTGDNLRNTFIISSAYPEFFADVEEIRREEFRQLILKIKPVQTVGFLFINYTT
jgi:hypothetical protein